MAESRVSFTGILKAGSLDLPIEVDAVVDVVDEEHGERTREVFLDRVVVQETDVTYDLPFTARYELEQEAPYRLGL